MEKQKAIIKLLSLAYLSPECREHVLESFAVIRKEKDQFIAKPGQEANKLWYLYSGILKAYYLSNSNWQNITSFCCEDEYLVDSYLFFYEMPYPYYVQCIEDCVLVELRFGDLKKLIKTYPEFGLLSSKLAAISSQKAEIKNRVLNKRDAVLKYKTFCKWYPYHHRINRRDQAHFINVSNSRLRHIIYQNKK